MQNVINLNVCLGGFDKFRVLCLALEMLKLGLRNKWHKARAELRYWAANHLGQPNIFNLNTPERVGAIYNQPTDMCAADRIMIYALVRGLRPKRALEIGARWGGSGRIIANAMEDNGEGKVVGIDPEPGAFRAKPKDLHNRYELIAGFSPEQTPRASAILDGPIDFVFIDALHIYDAVLADFRGVIPFLAPGAHILFHDTYHQGVNAAVVAVLKENPDFVDCGIITRHPTLVDPMAYQGLRLVRVGSVDSLELISEAHTRAGKEKPRFSSAFWNHDEYAIRNNLGRREIPVSEHLWPE